MAALLSYSSLSITGFIFFFAGIAFKISLVPFHFWTADVYEGAPIGITSYLSVISKGAAVTILDDHPFYCYAVLSGGDSCTLVYCGSCNHVHRKLFACAEEYETLPRFFLNCAGRALSCSLMANDQLGISTVVYFITIYVFTNLAAFGVIQAISLKTGKEDMEDYTGL